MTEKEKKALPFETSKGFSAVPSVIFTLYTKHPEFDVYTLVVYSYLLSRYNKKYGYAFPSQDEIAYTLHISESTVKRSIKKLKALGLIHAGRNSEFNNNVYYFVKPIEDEAEFFARFKEAEEAEREHNEKWAKIIEQHQAEKDRYKKSRKSPKRTTTPKDSGQAQKDNKQAPAFDADEIIKLL